MKKFYLSLLALVSTIAFTASANGWEKSTNVVKPKTFEAVAESAQAITMKKVSKKAPASRAGIATLEDIAGNYEWMYINAFNGSTETEEVGISVLDASNNTLLIEGLFGGSELVGVADLTAGTISIASVAVGYNDQYQEDVVFVTCENTGTDDKPVFVPTADDLILTYAVDEDGEFFQSMQFYGLVGRNAAGEYTYSDGYYSLYMYAIVEPNTWTLLGTGTVSGDVLYTTFGQANHADYEVEVYVSDADPNIYKVKDFLKGLYAALGIDAVSPDFKIDATDASNVSIPLQTTDIDGGTTDGLYYFASMNQNYESTENCPAENRGTLTITEDAYVFSFPAKSTLVLASTAGQLYFGNADPFTITIKKDQSGVENIAVDDANAPAEFFNLQGQRVAEPVKGNIYIKRQGAATSKVVF